MEPFSFSFSNGVVTGPNYSFDLKPIVNGLNEAEQAFYRASPSMLIHFVYENWNKTFFPECIAAGGNLNLGVTWYPGCLVQTGTPDLLTAAGQGILSAVAAWGTAYLGQATTPPVTNPPSGGTNPPTTIQCATVGKKPIVGQSCCSGLVKDAQGLCNATVNIPPPASPAVCVGTWVCSIPDMWIYGGLGILALMMMKR